MNKTISQLLLPIADWLESVVRTIRQVAESEKGRCDADLSSVGALLLAMQPSLVESQLRSDSFYRASAIVATDSLIESGTPHQDWCTRLHSAKDHPRFISYQTMMTTLLTSAIHDTWLDLEVRAGMLELASALRRRSPRDVMSTLPRLRAGIDLAESLMHDPHTVIRGVLTRAPWSLRVPAHEALVMGL